MKRAIFLLIAVTFFIGCSNTQVSPGGGEEKIKIVEKKVIVEKPIEIIKEVEKEITPQKHLEMVVYSCRVRDENNETVGYYQPRFPKIYNYELKGNFYKIGVDSYIHKNCMKEVILSK